MCYFNDDTGCYGQSQGTIPIFDGAVRAIHLVAEKHGHPVLSIQVPVSMLSKILAVVELAIPRSTSSLPPSRLPFRAQAAIYCPLNVDISEM
jgi:hypothetical protein